MVHNDMETKISHLERSETEIRKEITDLKNKLTPILNFQTALKTTIKGLMWTSGTLAALGGIFGFIMAMEKRVEDRLRNGHTDHIMDKVHSHVDNQFIENGYTKKDPDPTGE